MLTGLFLRAPHGPTQQTPHSQVLCLYVRSGPCSELNTQQIEVTLDTTTFQVPLTSTGMRL